MTKKCEGWYEYWFAGLRGIGAARKWSLRRKLLTAEALYNIEETSKKGGRLEKITEEERKIICASRKEKDWEREYQRSLGLGVRCITRMDEEFPEKLKELPGMPYALYVRGRMPDERKKTAAIVGARRCSPYGEKMTLEFAERLAGCGVQIISGMARGIDGAAHRGAENAGGETFAVLGCGPDICYPKEHRGLYEDLIKKGGLISEYPPGTQPMAAHFPARNRIISGLSDVVLVMEAKEKSGSLITADMALEQGRDVYALPGPVNSVTSRGCNRLIRQGAGILLEPQELLEELQIDQSFLAEQKTEKEMKNKIMLESAEKLVYSKCDLCPKSREELMKLTGLSARELAAVLVTLELKGYIEERSKNYVIRHR